MPRMGASSWVYLVPYQVDLQAALDSLRHRVFESGDYISPVTVGLNAPECVRLYGRGIQGLLRLDAADSRGLGSL
jgi:hypothetical protein